MPPQLAVVFHWGAWEVVNGCLWDPVVDIHDPPAERNQKCEKFTDRLMVDNS